MQHRAGDREQLLLALRDVGDLLVEYHVVAFWQRGDEVVGLGDARGSTDFLIGRIEFAVADGQGDGSPVHS